MRFLQLSHFVSKNEQIIQLGNLRIFLECLRWIEVWRGFGLIFYGEILLTKLLPYANTNQYQKQPRKRREII